MAFDYRGVPGEITLVDYGGERLNVRSRGVKGDALWREDASMSNGSPILQMANTVFAASDVGKYVVVPGAGVAGANLISPIVQVNGADEVVLDDDASTTVAGEQIVFGTSDNAALEAALSTLIAARGGELILPHQRSYLITPELTLTGPVSASDLEGGISMIVDGQIVGTTESQPIVTLQDFVDCDLKALFRLRHANVVASTTSGHLLRVFDSRGFEIEIYGEHSGCFGAGFWGCEWGDIIPRMRNTGRDGLHLTALCKHLTVRDGWFDGVGDDAAAVVAYAQQGAVPGVGDDGGQCEDITFRNLRMRRGVARGFTFAGVKRGQMVNCPASETRGPTHYVQQESNVSWVTYGNDNITLDGCDSDLAGTYDPAASGDLNLGAIQIGSQSATYPTRKTTVRGGNITRFRYRAVQVGSGPNPNSCFDTVIDGTTAIGGEESVSFHVQYAVNTVFHRARAKDAWQYGFFATATAIGVRAYETEVEDANQSGAGAVDGLNFALAGGTVVLSNHTHSGTLVERAWELPAAGVRIGGDAGGMPIVDPTQGVVTSLLKALMLLDATRPFQSGDTTTRFSIRHGAPAAGDTLIEQKDGSGVMQPAFALTQAGAWLLYAALGMNLRGLPLAGIQSSASSNPTVPTNGIALREDRRELFVDFNTTERKIRTLSTATPGRASTAYNPGTVTAGAPPVIVTYTVSGALPGDRVEAWYDQDYKGVNIWGWVSAADTVKVARALVGVAPTDNQTLANGTIYIDLFRD